MKKNKFKCKSCGVEAYKRYSVEYNRGDIAGGKKFIHCNLCIRKKEDARKINRVRYRSSVKFSINDKCSMCDTDYKSLIIYNHIYEVMPYFANKKKIVCSKCDNIHKCVVLLGGVYLAYSEKKNLFKIGFSRNFSQRIKSIRRERHPSKDWIILLVSYVKLSDMAIFESEMHGHFNKYAIGNEYFKGIEKNRAIKIFQEKAKMKGYSWHTTHN
ncbi:hypothetical protein MNB_SV-12-336 [hydrothermal vent metagenome]|uniref:Bacteriophage T5 Orf172 DNA-binding domain-containing protein n=1 Tax=hydrothermal vent metagenome TaxID=652676 RepID=A0A1W1BIL4_9ZZZZ